MASPFQRYQSGIEASTGNLVQAYGQMAGQTANAIAGFGQNLAQGLQQYNENSAKNDVLTAEAEQLGLQIQQFAAQFGDSPEHKPFADSLQPYIEQLAKVPSQSLTQKMGTVTGVKAAFGNIGQQLQVFELMRKERMARDINVARGGVREFDEQTVPTAIIPSGKLPYFYNKNYTEQEGELVRLANEAKARGASVDLPSVLDNWRKGLKANAMSRPDLPPEIKERLVKQIDAGEGLTENIQTDESGVTDYAKEAEMYEKASTSVKEQLAPPKVKVESEAKPDADTIATWNAKKKAAEDAIGALQGRAYNKTAYEKAVADYDALVKKDKEIFDKATADWKSRTKDAVREYESIPDRIDKLRSMLSRIPEEIPDDSPRGQKFGRSKINPEYTKVEKQIKDLQERRDELSDIYYNQEGNKPKLQTRTAPSTKDFEVAGDTTPNAAENIAFYAKQVKEADKNIGRITRIETAKKESVKLEKQIKDLEAKIADGETLAPSEIKRYQDNLESAFLKYWEGAQNIGIPTAIRRMGNEPITQESADRIVAELKDGMGGHAKLSALVNLSLLQEVPIAKLGVNLWTKLGIIPEGRQLTKNEARYIENAIKESTNKNDTSRALKYGTETEKLEALKKLKAEFDSEITTGVRNPSYLEQSKMQTAKPAEAKPEPEYALTNQYNMTLGTTTASVATSLESKRNDMKTFFQNKYGYVPASFEESFKAIYPEANFKTMETPYGVFMYDGKDWKQVQMQQVKPPSRKELAEEKAVSFGKLQPDSSIDINEFGELVPNSGVYVRGIFGGSPEQASKFRADMLEGSNAKKAVARLIEINDMVGESLPWNAKVWGEAKALLPQIKAGLRIDIIGVGTVSNYEQELINDVVADPAKFWSLESSDRAKLTVIMDKISNALVQKPANYGLEVKVAGKPNAEIERRLKMGNAGKSKLELDFEARGGKKGVGLNWNLTNKIPDALKQ